MSGGATPFPLPPNISAAWPIKMRNYSGSLELNVTRRSATSSSSKKYCGGSMPSISNSAILYRKCMTYFCVSLRIFLFRRHILISGLYKMKTYSSALDISLTLRSISAISFIRSSDGLSPEILHCALLYIKFK